MKNSGFLTVLICITISLGAGFFVAKDLEHSLGAIQTLSAFQYWGGVAFVWFIGICVFFLVLAVLLFIAAPRPTIRA